MIWGFRADTNWRMVVEVGRGNLVHSRHFPQAAATVVVVELALFLFCCQLQLVEGDRHHSL